MPDPDLTDILSEVKALRRMLESFIGRLESYPLAGEALFDALKAKDATDSAIALMSKYLER